MRLLLTLLLLAAAPLGAHQIDEITLTLETTPDEWKATLELDAAYMLPEYRGDADIAPFDLAWLRSRDEGEWQRIREETRRFLRDALTIGASLPEPSFPDFEVSPPAFADAGVPEALPMITVVLRGKPGGSTLPLAWREAHGVVLLVDRGDEVLPLVSGEAVELEIDGPPSRNFGRWIVFGFRHILPDGLDHILFVLGVFLLVPKWKPLLYQSLTFTLAHSLTLAAAALGWVVLPSRWVEAGIALSIAWIALENLRPHEPGPRRYALIAGFGLVHGLGFARMLAEALPDAGPVLLPLVGFNLGVEFGQVVVLAGAFALAGWWKEKAFHYLRTTGSVAIAVTGFAWAVERALLSG